MLNTDAPFKAVNASAGLRSIIFIAGVKSLIPGASCNNFCGHSNYNWELAAV
jgi:hypothetical protein